MTHFGRVTEIFYYNNISFLRWLCSLNLHVSKILHNNILQDCVRAVFNLDCDYRCSAYLRSYTFVFPYHYPNSGLRYKEIKLILFEWLKVSISHDEPNFQALHSWPLLTFPPQFSPPIPTRCVPPTSAWELALLDLCTRHLVQTQIGTWSWFLACLSFFLSGGRIHFTRFKHLLA